MAGGRKGFPSITADQAHAALRWLVATRKLSIAQVRAALRKREALVVEIRRRLEELGAEGARFLAGPEALRDRVLVKRRRRRRPSAKARAAWKAQGRYMAAVRRLSKADRVKVKKIREAKGVGPSIVAAKRLVAAKG